MLFTVLVTLLKILSTTVPLLLAVAFFTVAERKIMGAIQRRRGPNVVGFVGLLQAIADGLKLLVKETILLIIQYFCFIKAGLKLAINFVLKKKKIYRNTG